MSQKLTTTNPATGEVLEELEAEASEAIEGRISRARQAQPGWAERPLQERVEALVRWRDALQGEADELSRTLAEEVGKPVSQARGEVLSTRGRVDFFVDHVAREIEGREVHREPGLVERIEVEPMGVVANISAWNYPYFVGSNVFVPALLCGNAVLYKASEHATRTGRHITRMLHEAGVPEDVFQQVVGAGEAGRALVESGGIDAVFFTGSWATGRRIAESCAPRLIPLGLELGGKDPAYVRPDVDVARAAAGLAEGAFYNTGQSCCAVERIYVHRSIYEDFLEHFLQAVDGFVVGDPLEEATFIGPLARAEQLDVLEAQVQDALDRGARLLRGGERLRDRPGNFFAPTVVADVPQEAELMREESFGPVIGIRAVEDDEEAVRLMNDTHFGLTAAVYTEDARVAQALMRRLDAGSVYWNCCDRVSPRLPWSGRRRSGLGSTLSELGIRAFLQPKAYHLRG